MPIIGEGCRFATGTYTGDGTLSQAITRIGFTPRLVHVIPQFSADTLNRPSCLKIDQHTADMCLADLFRSHYDNMLNSLDSDGFTVDDNATDADPNTLGQVYIYWALG